ncbi:adenylate isopentenyltransferase 5, chloroplastic-like [Sesamum indicum]|uniref:Adenylate isopentenyltransferase 5, chloroplastic-like n=1 Tax=Sesamum indicum TaxID=4182 RepID=A0A6I9V2M8_SESIN|nr:adenylate isopentenyltransferase 5, chloroplastic-like [Sesamum indicum]
MMNKHRGKDKVVLVLGATGTGKLRLAIDLATRFGEEVINSDKIQVYKGLYIVTNRVSNEECRGVPQHLLAIVDPEVDFTVHDFVHHALLAADTIVQKNRLSIIVRGSNSFIQAKILKTTIDKINMNTWKLACRQVENISRMKEEFGWQIHWLNATEVFLRRGGDANEAWKKFVLEPITNIVARFICKENIDPKPTVGTPSIAVAAATTNNWWI